MADVAVVLVEVTESKTMPQGVSVGVNVAVDVAVSVVVKVGVWVGVYVGVEVGVVVGVFVGVGVANKQHPLLQVQVPLVLVVNAHTTPPKGTAEPVESSKGLDVFV